MSSVNHSDLIAEEPAAALAKSGSVPPDWYPDQERQRWVAIADKIEADPRLLRLPIENMDRWQQRNAWDGARIFAEWRDLINGAQASQEGMIKLLTFLRSDTETARYWKSFDPFPGVLTIAENKKFACTWGP